MPVPRLQKLIMAMGDKFLTLEYLYITSSTRHNIGLMLLEMFRALHLCHLILGELVFDMGSAHPPGHQVWVSWVWVRVSTLVPMPHPYLCTWDLHILRRVSSTKPSCRPLKACLRPWTLVTLVGQMCDRGGSPLSRSMGSPFCHILISESSLFQLLHRVHTTTLSRYTMPQMGGQALTTTTTMVCC
jgi:hypothetical protein